MTTSNSSLIAKCCACVCIELLSGIFSWSVDYAKCVRTFSVLSAKCTFLSGTFIKCCHQKCNSHDSECSRYKIFGPVSHLFEHCVSHFFKCGNIIILYTSMSFLCFYGNTTNKSVIIVLTDNFPS
jgi:hypothetical protein